MEEISIQSEGCNLLRTERERQRAVLGKQGSPGNFSSQGMNLYCRQEWDRVDSNSREQGDSECPHKASLEDRHAH